MEEVAFALSFEEYVVTASWKRACIQGRLVFFRRVVFAFGRSGWLARGGRTRWEGG